MFRRQIIRFAIVGLTASAVHVVTGLGSAALFGLPPLQANTAAFLVALGVSYLGHSLWTFEVRASRLGAFARFIVLSLVAFAANQAIVYGLTSRLGWPYAASLAVVLVTVPPLTFVGARFWALMDPSRRATGAQ